MFCGLAFMLHTSLFKNLFRVCQVVFKIISKSRKSSLWASASRLEWTNCSCDWGFFRYWRASCQHPSRQRCHCGRLGCRTYRNRELYEVIIYAWSQLTRLQDNIEYYKCDVSKWSEVEAVAKRIAEEVCPLSLSLTWIFWKNTGRWPNYHYKQCRRRARKTSCWADSWRHPTVCQCRSILSTLTVFTRTFGVNTMSHFHILKAFLPSLLKRKTGHVVGHDAGQKRSY